MGHEEFNFQEQNFNSAQSKNFFKDLYQIFIENFTIAIHNSNTLI